MQEHSFHPASCISALSPATVQFSMPVLTTLLHTGSAQNLCICTLTGTELCPVTAGAENAEGERDFPSLGLPCLCVDILLAACWPTRGFHFVSGDFKYWLDSYSYGKLQGSQHHLMAWLAMEVEGLDALFVHCRNISPQRMLFWSCKIQTLPKPSARFSAVLPLPSVFYFLVKDAVLFGGCNSVIGH